MTFAELLEEIKRLKSEEERKTSDDYLERVFSGETVKALCPLLEKYFGPPFKPAGTNPDKIAVSYADPYGGIQKDQILYYVEKENLSNCAMLWPWNDGKKVTFKIAQGMLRKKV